MAFNSDLNLLYRFIQTVHFIEPCIFLPRRAIPVLNTQNKHLLLFYLNDEYLLFEIMDGKEQKIFLDKSPQVWIFQEN